MLPAQLVYWDPLTREETTVPISGVDEVEQMATRLLQLYQEIGSQLPGLGLQLGTEFWESLTIAVAPMGWALFHLAEDMTPHCTKAPDAVAGESLPVCWDEETLMPRDQFIPASLALVGVRQWLEDGTLSPVLTWSDQCA